MFCAILFDLDFPSFGKRINNFPASSVYGSAAVISHITLQDFFSLLVFLFQLGALGSNSIFLWLDLDLVGLHQLVDTTYKSCVYHLPAFVERFSFFPFTSCLSVLATETRWFSIPLMFPLVVDYSEIFEGCTRVGH